LLSTDDCGEDAILFSLEVSLNVAFSPEAVYGTDHF